MKVSLIDYTGYGHYDRMYAAKLLAYAKNTRLTQGGETLNKFMQIDEETLKEELKYIANTIRSSWEFVDFTFQIEGVTRAFTHQLVRTRTASYAQQAQRVVNMSEFSARLPYSIADRKGQEGIETNWQWDNAILAIRHAYTNLIAAGIPAQDARGLLPTNVHTNILMKCNLRTLSDLLAKRKNLRAQDEYTEVIMEMEKCVLEVMPWADSFLSPERTSTPVLDAILKELLGSESPVDKPKLNDALKELDKLKGTWG